MTTHKEQAMEKRKSEQDELLDRVSKDSSPDELRRAAEIKEQQLRTQTPFPSWRYHASKPAVLVNSEEEAKALGEGYTDTPEGGQSGPSNPELASLAEQTQALADRAASAAGIQTAHDKQRAESHNMLREALGGAQSPETAQEQRRLAGQQANREAAETKAEAQKLADYNKQEAETLAKATGQGDYATRKAELDKKKGAAKTSSAKKTGNARKAKTGKLGGTSK